MPGNSVMKSHEYRPIIGFLTDIIDQSFTAEDVLIRSAHEGGVHKDTELVSVRARLDAAYKALERLLELILEDLDEEQWKARGLPDRDVAGEKTYRFLAEIFPDDAHGQDLLQRFYHREEKADVH